MLTVHQRQRRTDGRTDYLNSNTALALRVSRGKNVLKFSTLFRQDFWLRTNAKTKTVSFALTVIYAYITATAKICYLIFRY